MAKTIKLTAQQQARALELLSAISSRVVPAGEDSTGQRMVKVRFAIVEQVRAFLENRDA